MRREAAPPTAGEQMEAQVREEQRAYRRECFSELLASEGWKQVLKPALMARAQKIAQKLATMPGGIEEVRREQGRFKELAWLVGLTADDVKQLFEDDR
jgi:hypothetical protein